MQTMRAGDLAFGAAAAFMAGVFAANEHWNIVVLSLAVGVAVWAAGAFMPAMGDARRWALLAAAICFAGAFYYSAFTVWRTMRTKLPYGKDAAFFGVVAEEPKPTAAGDYLLFPLALRPPYAGTIDVFVPSYDDFHYGDFIWVQGNIEAPPPGSDELPAMFRPSAHLVARHDGWAWKEWVTALKASIAVRFARALPPDQAALLSAIVLGQAGTVGAMMKAQMEASGTSYIVGMYGFKIAIIMSAIDSSLKDHLPRWCLLGITAAAMAVFTAASGANISVMRAAMMGAFGLAARATRRLGSPRNALALSALLMVLADPTLTTNAAFQLSFLSYGGIYYLKDPINALFGWRGEGFLQWKQHAMLSLATNLAIVPVVMNTFGGFSLASFLSNVFIMIPWVALLVCGALIAAAGAAAPPVAFIAAKVAGIFLMYELSVIKMFAAIDIPIPAVFGAVPVVMLYYGLLVIVAHYYRPDRRPPAGGGIL